MDKLISGNPKKSVPWWIQLVIWLALIGLLLLVALGISKVNAPTLKIGTEVPHFNLTLYSGYEFHGEAQLNTQLLQGKIIVINFWASWCEPCEGEADELEEAWRMYETTGDVIFLGINYVDTDLEARKYLTRAGITYPNGPDIGTKISHIFNRNLGVPETYFIDRNNILRYIKIGPFFSIEEITRIVDSLLYGN